MWIGSDYSEFGLGFDSCAHRKQRWVPNTNCGSFNTHSDTEIDEKCSLCGSRRLSTREKRTEKTNDNDRSIGFLNYYLFFFSS